MNNGAYYIQSENELATVLSHFNSEYVLSVVQNAIDQRFTNITLAIPNAVSAWEQNFKAIMDTYGSQPEVIKVRAETYQEIIGLICNTFGLNFTSADVDLYTAACKLYQLFICDFNEFIVSFFANYIYKERSSIYDAMRLGELKKNKDIDIAYSKKIYKDSRIVVINSYIDQVIYYICSMDFDLYTVLNIAIPQRELVQYYIDTISPNVDFFRKYIVSVFYSDAWSGVMTSIRFRIHDIAKAHDQLIPNGIDSMVIRNEEE